MCWLGENIATGGCDGGEAGCFDSELIVDLMAMVVMAVKVTPRRATSLVDVGDGVGDVVV